MKNDTEKLKHVHVTLDSKTFQRLNVALAIKSKSKQAFFEESVAKLLKEVALPESVDNSNLENQEVAN
ncbi:MULTISPECIES: hypothetical protein [unclassified Pseudoalteromonas]|uniref:hypothetical protein n=1 Tax=unclassified Pseudoalteromonas TaxID=194690 RepID=UPI001F2D26E1|nr:MULTISPECIES: hypothetical protein [unclassified Pseudoalteromonas]MCF2829713.1 hypothetical protein [Pseudoalteromonas sp. OF5H-5]MCF2832603.1 hypothetical protein [Pseudoalteromonas sp. DL2-H6]MCF2927603.1 hypothetical protein [Pseudoalteromonas sp. DL2-H1]